MENQTSTTAAPSQADPNLAPATPEPRPIDPIETELSAKYGEQWSGLSDEIKSQVVAAEKKGRDADRRYQAVAKLQKDHELTQRQAAQLLDLVANDPESVFSNPSLMKRLNRDKLLQFAEKIVWEKVQNDRLKPEERELRDLRAYREENETAAQAKREAEEKAQAESEMNERIGQKRAYWESEIIKTLKAEGVEADGAFVGQMARYIQASRRAGKPVDLSRIVKQVQADFNNWQMRYLTAGFKPRQEGESNEAFAGRYEQWVSRLSPQLVELIRSGDLAKLKNKNMGRPSSTGKTEPRKEASNKISMSEWLAKRSERLNRK